MFANLTNLENIISFALNFFVFAPLLIYFNTKNTFYLYAFFTTPIVSLMTSIIKHILVHFYPKWKVLYRPSSKAKCSMTNKWDKTVLGMPSGHVATATFVSLIMFNYIYNWYGVALITIAMSWSRYKKKCHNIYQVSLGALFGSFSFYCFVYLYYKK